MQGFSIHHGVLHCKLTVLQCIACNDIVYSRYCCIVHLHLLQCRACSAAAYSAAAYSAAAYSAAAYSAAGFGRTVAKVAGLEDSTVDISSTMKGSFCSVIIHSADFNLQLPACSVLCSVYSVPGALCCVQCAVCCVLYAVCSV